MAKHVSPWRSSVAADSVTATQLALVSREMILCYIAEREFGLPKSY
jgi:hypothetical protein